MYCAKLKLFSNKDFSKKIRNFQIFLMQNEALRIQQPFIYLFQLI